jgi:hypothetical protein
MGFLVGRAKDDRHEAEGQDDLDHESRRHTVFAG